MRERGIINPKSETFSTFESQHIIVIVQIIDSTLIVCTHNVINLNNNLVETLPI